MTSRESRTKENLHWDVSEMFEDNLAVQSDVVDVDAQLLLDDSFEQQKLLTEHRT
jgi:hypothetical protein